MMNLIDKHWSNSNKLAKPLNMGIDILYILFYILKMNHILWVSNFRINISGLDLLQYVYLTQESWLYVLIPLWCCMFLFAYTLYKTFHIIYIISWHIIYGRNIARGYNKALYLIWSTSGPLSRNVKLMIFLLFRSSISEFY